MENVQRHCKLCCNNISSDENYKIIEDDIKYMFEVLLMKLIDNEGLDVLCKVCYSELVAAFKFKSTCLETDNIIMPYVDFENSTSVDLKNIYVQKKGSNQESNALDGLEICRLCLQPTGSKKKSVLEVPFDSIQIYIPEINFAVTTNPIICTQCFVALQIHSTFLKKSSEKEEKVDVLETKFGDILSTNSYIKPEEFEIKTEEVAEQKPVEIFYFDIKKEEDEAGNTSLNGLIGTKDTKSEPSHYETCHLNRKSETSHSDNSLSENDRFDKGSTNLKNKAPLLVQIYKCDECDYKTIKRAHLLAHGLKHRDPSEVKMYTCDKCRYKSVHKSNLVKHQLKHKDPSEMPVYKCERCSYTTTKKGNLKQHQTKHTGLLQVEMYSCEECNYKCLYKSTLDRHQLRHKDLLQVQVYQCDECDYKSNSKSNLSRHQLRHKDQVQMYKCDECGYQSNNKNNLNRHLLRHKDPEQLKLFKCDICGFKSVNKDTLKEHHLKHNEPSQIQMYECSDCDYKSFKKDNLKQHQLRHKDPAQLEMYKCTECDYKSIEKGHLKRHRLRHTVLKAHVYECDECNFTSKRKMNFVQHLSVHKNRMHRCDKCSLENCRGICEIVKNANAAVAT